MRTLTSAGLPSGRLRLVWQALRAPLVCGWDRSEAVVAKTAARGSRLAAKDRALDYVKYQIPTGAFPGGEPISEGEVADALGMSRSPVREAFLRLKADGLLRLYPGL